jgi:hypothetical protein
MQPADVFSYPNATSEVKETPQVDKHGQETV